MAKTITIRKTNRHPIALRSIAGSARVKLPKALQELMGAQEGHWWEWKLHHHLDILGLKGKLHRTKKQPRDTVKVFYRPREGIRLAIPVHQMAVLGWTVGTELVWVVNVEPGSVNAYLFRASDPLPKGCQNAEG